MRTMSLGGVCVAALILNGCASLQIENRGLPKCSGNERRPLNADLWDWQSKAVEDTGIIRVPRAAPIEPSTYQDPKAAPIPLGPDKAALPDALETGNWNIAASYETCGDNSHG